MSTSSSLDAAFQRAQRLVRVLGSSPDPVLVVLRSHLLLEEQLHELVAAAAREPGRLVKARLSSSQVLAVAHALVGGAHNEVPWSFLAGLNRLRNRLAHEVEAPDIELEMARLTRLVPVSTDAAIYLPQKAVYMFTLAVARVAGELHSRGRALIRTPAAPSAT